MNQVVRLMPTCWHFNEKSGEVCIKARSPGNEARKLKWPIRFCLFVVFFLIYLWWLLLFYFQSEIPPNVGYYILVGLVLLFYVTFLLLLVSASFWKFLEVSGGNLGESV